MHVEECQVTDMHVLAMRAVTTCQVTDMHVLAMSSSHHMHVQVKTK